MWFKTSPNEQSSRTVNQEVGHLPVGEQCTTTFLRQQIEALASEALDHWVPVYPQGYCAVGSLD